MKTTVTAIICPKCKEKQDATLYTEINAQTDLETKNELMKGTLFAHTCKLCQFKAPIAYNSTYIDTEKHFAIHLSANRDEPGIRDVMNNCVQNDALCEMNRRLVFNANSFREKVMIFDAGLNDRVIELIKIFYVTAIQEKNPKLKIRECYFSIVDNKWRIEALAAGGSGAVFEVDKNLYDEFVDTYKAAIDSDEFTFEVNADTAIKLYNKTNN